MKSPFFAAVLLSGLATALHADPPPAPADWKTKSAMTATAKGGDNWWTVFDDPKLNELIKEAQSRYPGLQAALARVDQARAAVRTARSGWFPRVTANGVANRSNYSDTSFFALGTMNTFTMGAELSYEMDLWGKVRGQVNAARSNERAAETDATAIRLVLAGEVARLYFTLRSLDEETVVLNDTLTLRGEALKMATARVEAGATNELDRVRAEAELAGTEAEIAALAGPRADLENTLALTLGRQAGGYTFPATAATSKLPSVPKVLPSELVQRRPDVAAIMRRVSAAQAAVGVAKAAYWPKVSLTAGTGLDTINSERFFDRDSGTWSVGLRFSVPLFVGGQRKADLESARGALKEVTSKYEEQVLTAFKEVESALARLQAQQTQTQAQERLQTAAEAAAKLARQRYTEGVTTYLEVIEAERTALAAKRALVQLHGQRQVTTVQLIQALGGGWSEAK